MAKRIKQFIVEEVGEVLSGESVVMLGIQAAPGSRFQINNGGDIEVGFFGIYELDLTKMGGTITSLKIIEIKKAPIIIDVVYEDGGAL